MFAAKKTFVRADMMMTELFFENPSLLLLMEHFDLDFVFSDKTVLQICNENKISKDVFISFANLYNGFGHAGIEIFSRTDIKDMLTFLRNSHQYYKNEKYPEILNLIGLLYEKNSMPEIKMIEEYFFEYFEEVVEHLDYEDRVAFPYISELIQKSRINDDKEQFSVDVYREHHTDIEFKLTELKNLLLRYIPLNNDRSLRRRLLFSLFELENDLNIHSTIEDGILIPLIKSIENDR